jgi:hypothetical protein
VNTNELICVLTEDAKPQWPFRSVLLLAIVGAVAIAGGAFFLGVGFRPDISLAVHSLRFLLKFVLTGTLAVGAAGAALNLGRPDGSIKGWGWVIVASPLLLICAIGLELAAMPEHAWMSRLVGHNSRFCLTLIPLLSIGPLVCLLAALRRGAPRDPRLAGALAGLAASSIAATFYAANCTDDSPLFVATWYAIAISMVVVTGSLIGARILRW